MPVRIPRADMVEQCASPIRFEKTVKKTVRSNCNPGLLSASFGPSNDYIHTCIFLVADDVASVLGSRERTHIDTRLHESARCSTMILFGAMRYPVLSLYFLRNSIVLEPFLPTDLPFSRSHPLSSRKKKKKERALSRTGDKASRYSPCFSRAHRGARWLFVDFRLPQRMEKKNHGLRYIPAEEETFPFPSPKEILPSPSVDG